MGRLQKLLLTLLLLVSISLSAIFGYGLFFSSNPNEIPSSLIGKPAPMLDFADLKTDVIYNIADFKGKKLVINVWASWCLTCRVEAPILEAFHQKVQKDGLDVVVIGIAVKDERDNAIQFADEFNKSYLLGIDNTNDDLLIDFGITAVPETFLIDTKGIIRKKFYGEISASDLEEIHQIN